MNVTRRQFIRTLAAGSAAAGMMTAKGYSRILGSNDRIRTAVVGFSDRCRASLLPPLAAHAKELNFEIAAVSDIWNRRREEGAAFVGELTGKRAAAVRNNDELYEKHKPDAVIISTADFQHALHCAEAVRAGCDVYVEKPFAETMDDARAALKAVRETGKIVQIGSQRRSGANYIAANEYIRSGKFGPICMVEMTWNVNQPGRWRRPKLAASILESDTDWGRFLMNRPREPWNPRKYVEYRLFWPYSSGIPGQWMCHQIDTIHWFTGLPHPRSVTANGGIYVWKDGRQNFDTVTAVFDYGPAEDPSSGFQAVYMSRMTNSSGETKEWYFSNAGKLDLDRNTITSEGGLTERYASEMDMKPNLLQDVNLPSETAATAANTGGDSMTSAHVKNWMECVRKRKTPNAGIEAGYNHSIACIMATAALHTGRKATFDTQAQEVMAGGNVFQY
jgi:predicted dehydrogenase